MSQIKPLGTGAPIWEYESSEYPDLMRMPMEDGTVKNYRLEIEQPEPRVMKCIDLIRVMNKCTYGGYKPRRNKKSR